MRRNNVSKSSKLCVGHMGHMSAGMHLLICVCVCLCVYPKSEKITSFLGSLCMYVYVCLCVCGWVCVCVSASERGGDIDLSLREKSSLFVN